MATDKDVEFRYGFEAARLLADEIEFSFVPQGSLTNEAVWDSDNRVVCGGSVLTREALERAAAVSSQHSGVATVIVSPETMLAYEKFMLDAQVIREEICGADLKVVTYDDVHVKLKKIVVSDSCGPVGVLVPPCPNCGKHAFLCDCATPLPEESPAPEPVKKMPDYTGEMGVAINRMIKELGDMGKLTCYFCCAKMEPAEWMAGGGMSLHGMDACGGCLRLIAVAGD